MTARAIENHQSYRMKRLLYLKTLGNHPTHFKHLSRRTTDWLVQRGEHAGGNARAERGDLSPLRRRHRRSLGAQSIPRPKGPCTYMTSAQRGKRGSRSGQICGRTVLIGCVKCRRGGSKIPKILRMSYVHGPEGR